MDILLNSLRNINSVNVDNINKIELNNKLSLITEYDVKNIISASDVFDAEREENSIYRIYGRIEYLSLFNGLKSDYTQILDFFDPTSSGKTIYDKFKFYLVKPTQFSGLTGNRYVRHFEVIATPSDFDLYNIGFSTNVYGEQEYAFSFSKDFDVSNYFDTLGFPITELFLYPRYVLNTNGHQPDPDIECVNFYQWNTTNTPDIFPAYASNTPLVIGDIIYGDIIQYLKTEFTQTVLSGQSYQVGAYVYSGNTSGYLRWKYNPFIPLRLRYFSSSLSRGNTGSTSYDQSQSIPSYATNLGGGNFIWREILPQGYFDPVTNVGVDYPFVNQRRYLFANTILDLIPDLSDQFTLKAFNDIKYAQSKQLNKYPTNDINEIGKPC